MNCSHDELAPQVLERFLRYAAIETTSDRHGTTTPSTPGQWALLRLLADELGELGVPEIDVDDRGYLIARIPGNVETGETVAFMAHVDTAPDVTAADVRPQIHRAYDGSPISLAGGLTLDPETQPELSRYTGETVITTDGTTLLGADDKAGVAEIMTAVACLVSDSGIRHGDIEVIFTPDEETGHGMDGFPLETIRASACYTLDGGEEGVIEIECFNAVRLEIECTGVAMHTGTARGKLVNAISMLNALLAMIPRNESPEATDGRYGFYVPTEISGSIESARCTMLIRDFEQAGVERRVEAVRRFGAAVEAAFPGGRVVVHEEKQYTNMRTHLEERPEIVERLEQAILLTDIEPERRLIRGGTDGSRLSEMGVPTPNVFTGGHNYHSRLEWAALPAMVRAVRTVVNLCTLWTGENA